MLQLLLTFIFENFTRWILFSPWLLLNDVYQKNRDIVGEEHAGCRTQWKAIEVMEYKK